MKGFTFIAKATKDYDDIMIVKTNGIALYVKPSLTDNFHLEDGEIYEIKITKKENND